jgi:hypothetical protein
VAVRSKAYLCGRLIEGIAGSKIAEEGISCLVFVVCFVRSGLCEGLISRSAELYRVCVFLYVCVRSCVSKCV